MSKLQMRYLIYFITFLVGIFCVAFIINNIHDEIIAKFVKGILCVIVIFGSVTIIKLAFEFAFTYTGDKSFLDYSKSELKREFNIK